MLAALAAFLILGVQAESAAAKTTVTVSPTVSPTEAPAAPTVPDWISAVASAIEAIALIVGGWWAYKKFIQGRLDLPRASLKQDIKHYPVEGQILVHVNTVITNPGTIVLRLEKGTIRLQQVLPLIGSVIERVKSGTDPVDDGQWEVLWPELGVRNPRWAAKELEIEPGENDEVAADFVIPDDVKTIEVYSYFENAQKKRDKEKGERPIGWSVTTLHDLKQGNATQRGPGLEELFEAFRSWWGTGGMR